MTILYVYKHSEISDV